MGMAVVSTAIKNIIVYPDRARITRCGKTRVPIGPQLLTVDGLPASLEPESLRASGSGTARATLYSVRTSREFIKEPSRALVAELRDKIEKLADQDRELADQEENLGQQSALLVGLAESRLQSGPYSK